MQEMNAGSRVNPVLARRYSLSNSTSDPPAETPPPEGAETPKSDAISRNSSTENFTRNRAATLDVPGLTRSKVSPDGRIAKQDVASKLVIVMVGLPARGKSYVTKKLTRFFNWQQHNCKIFNVGNTRRRQNAEFGPSTGPLPDMNEDVPGNETSHSGDFFSPTNPNSVSKREKWALETLDELLDYVLDGEGSVGILDATNTTVERRRRILKIVKERSNGQLKVLFLESICTRRDLIEANVYLKLSGPDYQNMDKEKALKDFLLRLKNYEKAYETIGPEEEDDPRFQYIKMINVGQKVECGNISGFLAGQTVFFLLNFNLRERQIWITRHGESTDNAGGRIGGDAGLTPRGVKYAKALARFMKHSKDQFLRRQLAAYAKNAQHILEKRSSQPPTPVQEPEPQNFCVWSSMLQRATETAAYFDEQEFDTKEMRMLNELDAGICDGMTYEEIKQEYPREYASRLKDKIRYRYPGVGGESYLDVINRLRPVICELERMEENCLVITHRVVARVLLAYFMNLGRDAIGELEVPLHTVYVVEPRPYGVSWAIYKYNERLDWFYKVPQSSSVISAQLKDKMRRFTVVATAGLPLGDQSLHQPPPEAVVEDEEDGDEVGELTLEEVVRRRLTLQGSEGK